MKSSWEYTRSKSTYHFDPKTPDFKPQVLTELGRITPTWLSDLDDIIANSRPATWATRGYKAEGIAGPQEDQEAEEYDLVNTGYGKDHQITHLNWKIPDSLERISQEFGLKDCMNRIHVQMPGEVWNLHLDKLQKWAPDNPDSIMRIMIQLTDWQPGQFWEYGNYHYNQWRAGDVTTFDWQNIPHSTANAGHHIRITFQITGIKTEKTLATLNKLLCRTAI